MCYIYSIQLSSHARERKGERERERSYLISSIHVAPFIVDQLQGVDVEQMLDEDPLLALELLLAD